MINLLPHQLKEEYRYAKRNRRLINWMLAFALAIVGVGAIATVGLLAINNSIDTYNARVAGAQTQLADENSADIEKQVTGMSNNLNLMVKVLSQEVLFSKLLVRLAQVTPHGVILANLTIAKNNVGLDVNALTTNYGAATQLQANLADPANQIFSKADIISVSCGGVTSANPQYPCSIAIQAQLATNSPFLFINAKAGAK